MQGSQWINTNQFKLWLRILHNYLFSRNKHICSLLTTFLKCLLVPQNRKQNETGWYSDFWILKTQQRGYLIPLLITYRVLTVHLFLLRRRTYSYVSMCSNLVKFYVILFHFDVHVQCIFQIIKETWVKLVI